MFNYLKKLLNKSIEQDKSEEDRKISGIFSTDILRPVDRNKAIRDAIDNSFQRTVDDFKASPQEGHAMDNIEDVKSQFSINRQSIPDSQVLWYASQGFIGYQMCALLAQHWLIDKACTMPAKDAIRKGYDITINDGTEIDPDIKDAIRQADVKYKLNEHLVEFARMNRIFGIRVAMFKVESSDEDYYKNPFNIDGVTPGSYKGIVQIDPYWITPELDHDSAANPASLSFYEPTWWRVNGQRVHKSHLIIIRTGELPDILKPTYIYGGVPLPQKIYERVYAAERTANEAPQLALTKRSTVLKVDLTEALANQRDFEKRIQQWSFFRDNYAIKAIGGDEEAIQFDTSLNDLDVVIMTQYQIVAAIANVPAVKLLGTSPKGFNATGEFEEASYHEELESMQTHELTPLIVRHHQLLIKSEIAPNDPFDTTVVWASLDSMTAKEKAELNKSKADVDSVLLAAGAIDGEDIRKRIIADPDSGYSGIEEEMPIPEEPQPLPEEMPKVPRF